MTHYLHFHPHLLDGIIIVSGAVVAAGLIWRFALRPWLRSIRYARRSAAHRRPEKLADPVWDDTGEHDRAWETEISTGQFDVPQWYDGGPVTDADFRRMAALVSTQYPYSNDGDYATELYTGSLLEPLPAPYARAWEQDRPVRTVNLPPWEVEEDPRECCVSCGAEVDHYLGCPDDPDPDYEAEAEYLREQEAWSQMPGAEPGTCGRCGTNHIPDAAPYGCARTPIRGDDQGWESSADPGDPATVAAVSHGRHSALAGDRSPESGSLSPRTPGETPASVTAGRATEHLPGPDNQSHGHRAGKARRIWSGVLGAPDPQNLAVPEPHGVPRTATAVQQQATGPAARDGQPDLPGPVEQGQGHRAGQPGLAGQDVDTGVLTGEVIHPGPPPPDDDLPTINLTINIAAGLWADDGWHSIDPTLFAHPALAYVREALEAPYVDGKLVLSGAS